MPITINDILKAIPTLSHDEVRKINQCAYGILKDERSDQVRTAKSKLRVGMKVRFGFNTGVITKINRTRCIVDTGGFRNFTVPMTMIEVI